MKNFQSGTLVKDFLRTRLRVLGITHTSFAQKLGISLFTVQSWISGTRLPRLDARKLKMICSILECDAKEFQSALTFSLSRKDAVKTSCVSVESIYRLAETVAGLGTESIPMTLVVELLSVMNSE
jgi:transcriptional regulator with XRE-family HTH domain